MSDDSCVSMMQGIGMTIKRWLGVTLSVLYNEKALLLFICGDW